MTPKITVNRFWNFDSVRTACVRNDLYTCGSDKEYCHMLDLVDQLEPNTENIYRVAKDIQEHSEDQTVSNVMYILEKETIATTFEIEGEEA